MMPDTELGAFQNVVVGSDLEAAGAGSTSLAVTS
ncbi:MAG: hypothetical protein JWM34_3263 [Ilumatobacteraceae bacterium]|nr:hypothetical protein [Ilumatobacteraceae bacterium]